jgi:LysR family transcriptional regulator, hydrogen peroxide-inducible genes activator
MKKLDRLNLNHWEYLLIIEKNQHFRWTAKKVGIEFAALSHAVKMIEESMGVRLFIRYAKHPVKATKTGKEVLERMKVILDKVHELEKFVNKVNDTASEPLRIGIIPTLAPHIGKVLVKKLSKRYKFLTVSTVVMMPDQILSEIKNGALDMGIVATPVIERKFLKYKLFDEKFYAYVSKDNNVSKGKHIFVSDVARYGLWLPADDQYYCKQILKMCRLHKAANANVRYEAGDINTLINLIDINQGLTFLPHLVTENLSSAQKENIRELGTTPPTREVKLITLNTWEYLGIVETIREILQQNYSLNITETEKEKIQMTE